MALSNIEIEKDGSVIRIRKQNADTSWTPWTSHNVTSIRSVVPNYEEGFSELDSNTNRPKNQYPYTDKMEICLLFTSDNGTKEVFDIQQVTNQAGWTADSAGFLQALSDINSWLTVAATTGGSGEFTPDAGDLSALGFPYTLPANTFKSVALVIETGGTIELNGATLSEGAYSFSGASGETVGSFTLDNPSGITSASLILTTF
jgi:hypothetical protein